MRCAKQYLHQFAMLLLIFLIAIQTCNAQVLTTDTNHEYVDQHPQKNAEPRQFGGGGFNANAAFNSNFASRNFGLNLGSNSNGNNLNRPTTAAPQTFSNFGQNDNFSNLNSINSLQQQNSIYKKEPTKNSYNNNSYNQKYPGASVIDRFNHHYPDGSYEYRYELSDGTARYERGYFLLYDNKKTLVVVGYYSYRMTDGRYITVFYNADQNGYRQNQSITQQNYPNLPRSIDVPQFKNAENDLYGRSASTTTPNPNTKPKTNTTRHSGRF